MAADELPWLTENNCFILGTETENIDKETMNEPETISKWTEEGNQVEENGEFHHDKKSDSDDTDSESNDDSDNEWHHNQEIIEHKVVKADNDIENIVTADDASTDNSAVENTENLIQNGDDNPNIEQYRNMFDENGKFNRDLIKTELEKDEYNDVIEASLPENADEKAFDHIRTPLYTIRLSSAYEDNLRGSHLQNKYMQKWAMDEFVAGRMKPGEMGNGIVLEDMTIDENTKKELMFIDHAFSEYISEMISVNRSLPDR